MPALRRYAAFSIAAALSSFLPGPLTASVAAQSRTVTLQPATPAPPVAVPGGVTGNIEPALLRATGSVKVVVRLAQPALSQVLPEGAIADRTTALSRGRLDTARAATANEQGTVIAGATRLGARLLARLEKSTNALVLRIDASRLPELATLPGVVSVRRVRDYQVYQSGSLAQAAVYLDAAGPRNDGFNGAGVQVAVFDSGIDFTHRNMGSIGTEAFYQQCYTGAGSPAAHRAAPVGACASYFGPGSPKVIGGFDFVGETWAGSADDEVPDPNPIDAGGHGTHVADILAGRSADNLHQGIAPGARLYAFKVCSAVSTSCSGVALLQAIELALDPDEDGDMSDAPAVWNFSLGSDYGQPEDDLTFALENVVKAGIVVVAAAGNAGDKPFVVGSPSTALGVISVAQTTLPDDAVDRVVVNSPVVPGLPDNQVKIAIWQSWSAPFTTVITADLQRPAVVGGLAIGCTAGDFSSFVAGRVALIDRGTCNISEKVSFAAAAGASAALIVNNVAGFPPSFGFGGGTPNVPAFSISQLDGARLKRAVAGGPVNVTLDPANATNLSGMIVSTSSRGPSIDAARVKPDIGAPGGWLSAEVGTGNVETGFSGTSGASPVVAGAAAIVLQKFPKSTPNQVKRRLVNTAATGIEVLEANAGTHLAPIARIGGGEVRIAPALASTALIGDPQNGFGNLSMGLPYVTGVSYLVRNLRLQNASNSLQTFSIAATFRDPADAALGALTILAPNAIAVAPKKQVSVPITFVLDGSKLESWPFTDPTGFGLAGVLGNNGSVLDTPEFDGYLNIAASGGSSVHLGWQVLPHRAADVTASAKVKLNRSGFGSLKLTNPSAVEDGLIEVFSLVGTSGKLPKPEPGEPGSPGSNIALIDVAAVGIRDDVTSGILQFAISSNGRRKTPLTPAEFNVLIDTDRDGDADYVVFNGPINLSFADGRTVVFVRPINSTVASAFFFADADFDSGNMILTVPLAALGLGPGSSFDAVVLGGENYSVGLVTDVVEGITYTVGAPRHMVQEGSTLVMPPDSQAFATVLHTGIFAPSSQTGLLLQYRNNAKKEFTAVTVNGGPTLILTTTLTSTQ